jgi:uncharacterized protein (TIGR03118 family)
MEVNDQAISVDRVSIFNQIKGNLTGNAYKQTNLVANKAEYNPLIIEPTFINAWGLAIRPAGAGGHFWVTGAGSGISYEYVGDVNGTPLFQDDLKEVTVPGPNGSQGSPTGVVFNGSQNFVITQDFPTGAITAPTKFLFSTDTGVISAWTERKRADGQFDWPSAAIPVIDRSAQGTQYFGITVNQAGDNIYAVDFGKNPKIQVFDGKFKEVTTSYGFKNPFDGGDGLQAGEYTPFNVQSLVNKNGKETIFVTYAKTREDPDNPGQIFAGEEDAGAGFGKLAAFDTKGKLLRVWDDGGLLNAPWGVTYAPDNFGKLANTLLVSNFGDGTITAFDPNTYEAIDYLRDDAGKPVAIEGIWGVLFGNGASLGDTDSLYFAAGPGEVDGVFGNLRSNKSLSLVLADAPTTKFIKTADDLLAQDPSIMGTDQNDCLYGSNKDDFFSAGAGDNTLFGKNGDNVFVAEDGNDVAYGGSGRDLFYLGDGNNTMYGKQGTNLFVTGKGDDVAYGGKDSDFFSLGDGDNIAYGKGGNDIFITGNGNDIIHAGSGKDYIYTGAGNDLIYANGGNDIIGAGTGDDTLYLGGGSNRLIVDKGMGSVTVWDFGRNDSIQLGFTPNQNDQIATKISGFDTQIYAGNDLLATLMNTNANINIMM